VLRTVKPLLSASMTSLCAGIDATNANIVAQGVAIFRNDIINILFWH
jgi:hypothetical protein